MKPTTVEVWARPATEEESPRAARQMTAVAELAGWKVNSTYARARRDGRLIETLALRMSHQDRRQYAVAIWTNGKFSDGLIGAPGWPRRRGANDLKRWLRDG